MTLRFFQILTTHQYRSKHDILNNGFVVIQIKMLEYHSHMTTVDIDINLRVCNIDTIEDDLTACWVFHTI